jgi:catalase
MQACCGEFGSPEQNHIISAFGFELSKVNTVAIRKRMSGHLHIVDESLANAAELALGMKGEATDIKPLHEPIDMALSGAPSVFSDALVILVSPEGAKESLKIPAAVVG